MKQIPAGKFKVKCLAVMDEVQSTGEPVVVTKHGKPVVKVVPVEQLDDDIFGYMAGRIKLMDDLIEPAAELDEWEALR